jgi:hypothetical protein
MEAQRHRLMKPTISTPPAPDRREAKFNAWSTLCHGEFHRVPVGWRDRQKDSHLLGLVQDQAPYLD